MARRTSQEPAPAAEPDRRKGPSRGERLTAAFRMAAKRASETHAEADNPVFGKINGRLTKLLRSKK
jgi:hypothetical protein